MNYHQAVCKSFDFFYQKIYKTSYKLDLSVANQRKMVDSFIKLLMNQYGLCSVGPNLIIEYFAFQFGRMSEWNVNRKISLGWVIGRKNFPRFVDRTKEENYYTNKFLHLHMIDLSLLRQQLIEDEIIHQGLDVAEEIEKERFKGQARLYNCLHNTTLFNHLSKSCTLCICRKDCKELLHQSNPSLFNRRGYK